MQRIIRRQLHTTNVYLKQYTKSPTRPLPMDFFQKSLPTLPFPDLQITLSSYLEQRSSVMEAKEYRQLEKMTNDFFENDGKILNQMLCEEYKQNKDVYGGYHYINHHLVRRISITQQMHGALIYPEEKRESQLTIATKILYSIGIVQQSIRNNTYKPIMFKSNPIFEDILLQTPEKYRTQVAQGLGIIPFEMSVYKSAFRAARLPGLEMDTRHVATDSKNVVIIRNGNLFSFDLLKVNGSLMTTAEILMNLENIKQQSTTTSSFPIAVFTAMKRAEWAEYRNYLLSNKENAEALKKIEDAIAVLTLDGEYETNSRGKPISLGEKPGDRWFDKCLSVSIDESQGLVGSIGNSTEAHASLAANISDNVLDVYDTVSVTEKDGSSLPTPIELLTFSVDDKLRQGLEMAKSEFYEIHSNYECVHFELENLSRKVLRQYLLSPDSVAHIAIQITLMKLLGRPQNTMTPVMLPSFINGHYIVTFAPWRDTVYLANMYHAKGKIDLSALRLHSNRHISMLMQMRLGLLATEPHFRALNIFAYLTGKGLQYFENDIVNTSMATIMDAASIPNERPENLVFTGYGGAMAFGYLFKRDKFHGTVTSGDKNKPSPESFKTAFMETMDGLLHLIAKH